MVSKVMDTCPPRIWFLPIQEPMVSFSVTWLSMDPHGPRWGMAWEWESTECWVRVKNDVSSSLFLSLRKGVLEEVPMESLCWSVSLRRPSNEGSQASRQPCLRAWPAGAKPLLQPPSETHSALTVPRAWCEEGSFLPWGQPEKAFVTNCLWSGLKDHL